MMEMVPTIVARFALLAAAAANSSGWLAIVLLKHEVDEPEDGLHLLRGAARSYGYRHMPCIQLLSSRL